MKSARGPVLHGLEAVDDALLVGSHKDHDLLHGIVPGVPKRARFSPFLGLSVLPEEPRGILFPAFSGVRSLTLLEVRVLFRMRSRSIKGW